MERLSLLLAPFLLLVITSGTLSQDLEPTFKNPPADTKGVKQYDVTMYCQVADKGKSNLYWHCNSDGGSQDVTVGPNRNTNPALARYIIDNEGASVGQYNLIITNVTDFDTGKCSCIIDTGKGNAIEAGADLDIMETPSMPQNPDCSINKDRTSGRPRGTFTANDDVQLICESQGGVPLADIHWEIVREQSNGRGINIVSSISATETGITAIADYKITAADRGAYFRCVQDHVSLPDPVICSPKFGQNDIGSETSPLEVEYIPQLRFIPSVLKVTPLETTRKTLKCVYDANPDLDQNDGGPWPSIRFKPKNEGDNITMTYTTVGFEDSVELTLTQDDNGKVLECIAKNELGYNVITLKIESTGLLPTWILVIIIGGGGLILFLICCIICCICFCGDGDNKDEHEMNRSRPGTFQGSELGVDDYRYDDDDGGYTGGYEQDPDMVNINEFEGGMEMKGHYDSTPAEDNLGYIVDDNVDDYDDDDIPPAPPLNLKSSSSRTYDSVPID